MNMFLYCALTASLYAAFTGIYNLKKAALLNPLLWSALVILLLCQNGMPYEDYQKGTQAINAFIGPITAVLAVPIYKNRSEIRKHLGPLLIGPLFAMLLSYASLYFLSVFFELPQDFFKSLVPKSVTTPIGLAISENIDGIGPLTVVSIIVSGIVGAVISPFILNLLHIQSPVAKGIGIGASSHVIGTTKAMEMGSVEGAMSGISLVLTGVFTYLLISALATFGFL